MNNSNPNLEPQLPKPVDLDSAFLELQEYNRKHTGLGRSMGNLLFGLMKIGEDESDDLNLQSSVDHEGEADIAKDIISLTTSHIFESAGLTIQDAGYVNMGGNRSGGIKQQPAIKDPVVFNSFLETIKLDGDEQPALEEGIVAVWNNMVSSTIEAAASDDIEMQDLSKEGAHLVERLLPEYQRLAENGLHISLEYALKVINWSSKPEFHDFFKMESIYGIQGRFAIEDWHEDSSADYYTKRWDNVFEHYVHVAETYGENSDLLNLMKARIKEGLEIGNSWVSSFEEPSDYVKNLINPISNATKKAVSLGIFK